jgi:hypothetical protein
MKFFTPVLSCPAEIRVAADCFKDILKGHYPTFVALLCGATMGLRSMNVIVRFLMFSPSVSTLSRFLNLKGMYENLNRRHRRRLLSIFKRCLRDKTRYMWAVDDTIIPHSGKNIWGAYVWHDHNTGGYVFGHKLLVLGLVDRKHRLLIPVFWEILHREDKHSDQKHEKGWQVSLRLLDSAISFGFPKLTFCADSWFSCEELFEHLDTREVSFVTEIKNNRKVVGHKRRRNLSLSVKEFFKKRTRNPIFFRQKKKWATGEILRFKDSKFPLKTVAIANKKGLVHEVFAYYVSNQLTWDASRIWAIARDRWSIEVQFRDLKQVFAIGGAAVRSKEAVETSISISVIALSEIRIEQIARADANKNQHTRPIPAGGIVNEILLSSLQNSVSKLASPNDLQIKEKVKVRIQLKNFGRKPTEEYKPPERRSRRAKEAKAA